MDPYGHTAEISKTLSASQQTRKIPLWLLITISMLLGLSVYLIVAKKKIQANRASVN